MEQPSVSPFQLRLALGRLETFVTAVRPPAGSSKNPAGYRKVVFNAGRNQEGNRNLTAAGLFLLMQPINRFLPSWGLVQQISAVSSFSKSFLILFFKIKRKGFGEETRILYQPGRGRRFLTFHTFFPSMEIF